MTFFHKSDLLVIEEATKKNLSYRSVQFGVGCCREAEKVVDHSEGVVHIIDGEMIVRSHQQQVGSDRRHVVGGDRHVRQRLREKRLW